MIRNTFKIVLDSDVIVSESSATAGGHKCLDHIPGSCFLGASASRLYKKLLSSENAENAFLVFHSGKVRFGSAYPLVAENPCYPVPLSWHLPKGDRPEVEDVLSPKICNLSNNEWADPKLAPKQVRNGYFSLAGDYVMPATGYRIKTAIDRNRGGRSADSQLFGYQSLAAGSEWCCHVDFDEDVSRNIIEQVVNSLAGSSIRVGRSRSAEYGRVNIIAAETADTAQADTDGDLVTVFCLSDLALRDASTGAPTVLPFAGHFGLSGELDLQRSFLRTRSYAPFNAKRGANDLERQVICKGSVLVFKGINQNLDLDVLQKHISAGVGDYRQDGLGQILVNPPFLKTGWYPHKVAAQVTRSPEVFTTEHLAPENRALAGWLIESSRRRANAVTSMEIARLWADEYCSGGLPVKGLPSSSQWGRLRNIGMVCSDRETLNHRVEELCCHGVSRQQWEKKINFKDGRRSIADQLKKQMKSCRDANLLFDALFRLGWEMSQRAGRKEV